MLFHPTLQPCRHTWYKHSHITHHCHPTTTQHDVHATHLRMHCRITHSFTNRYCTKGHAGVLCSVCEPKWYRRGSSSTCSECPADMQESLWWTAGISAVVVVAVIALVLLDLRFGWTRAEAGSYRLKLMVNCVQQITVITLFPGSQEEE